MIAILIGGIANAQWVKTNWYWNGVPLRSIAENGTEIYSGTGSASQFSYASILKSSDYGNTWIDVTNGLVAHQFLLLAAKDSNIYTVTEDKTIFHSTNNGLNWSIVNLGTTIYNIKVIVFNGSSIYIGTYEGIFVSVDNGVNWAGINNGLSNFHIYSLLIDGNRIIAGSENGVVNISTNNGASWSAFNIGSLNTKIISLALIGNTIFAGTDGNGIFISNNNGLNWYEANNGFQYPMGISSLVTNGSVIYAGTFNEGVFLSSDNGVNWVEQNTGFTLGKQIVSSIKIGNYIFVSLPASLWRRPLSELTGITETHKSKNLSLIHNPATNSLTLNLSQLQGMQNANLSIYDIQGKQLLHQNISQTQTQIDISSFAKGIYIVKVQTDKESLQSKFVKE